MSLCKEFELKHSNVIIGKSATFKKQREHAMNERNMKENDKLFNNFDRNDANKLKKRSAISTMGD